MFYVYEHWRLDRDECFYVGKGCGKRAYNMSNRNKHHKGISDKLNRTGSAVEVRMVATGLSEDEAFRIEIERIAFWKSVGADLANYSCGGEGKTGPHSEEHKRKISRSNKGKKLTKSQVDAVILSNMRRKGVGHSKRSPSHASALSKALQGRTAPNKKAVTCVSDGNEFLSASEAATAYGLKSVSSVSEVCNGNRSNARGLVFRYKEPT
jgi:hypothetical protein